MDTQIDEQMVSYLNGQIGRQIDIELKKQRYKERNFLVKEKAIVKKVVKIT